MPKKTAKQRSQKKPVRKPVRTDVVPGGDAWTLSKRQRKVAVFFGVVVVAGLLWWGFKAVRTELQFRQDKKQYAATEASMQKVYDEMVAAAGAPTESHLSKTCGHISLKYETGPLFCDITYDFFYPIESANEGKIITDKLEPSLRSYAKDGASLEKRSQPEDLVNQRQNYRVTGKDGLQCTLGYDSKGADLHNLAATTHVGPFTKTVASPLVATFVFDCNSFPAKPVYRVVDN